MSLKFFALCTMVMNIGGLIFFYIEHCYDVIPQSMGLHEQRNFDMCHIINTTFVNQTYDEEGTEIVWYNAQQAMIHKILPKEVTPFRVDFEGVAGLTLAGEAAPVVFEPDAFYPIDLETAPFRFEVYGRALVTPYDLSRHVSIQNIAIRETAEQQFELSGELHNTGTAEATIPHLLLTYYDENNHVVWVDDFYIENSVRPQRTIPFTVQLTPRNEVETLIDQGDAYANILQEDVNLSADWLERIPLPEGSGYSSVRLSVHYFSGSGG